MLLKKERKITNYFKYVFVLIILISLFLFRTHVTNTFFTIYDFFFNVEKEELTVTEREELAILRSEKAVLKDENNKLRQMFGVTELDESPVPVYMLLGRSTIYGSFYVTLPKDKTTYIGMNILSSGNIVVGQVEEILSKSLKVTRLGQNTSFIANSLENEESLELQSLGTGLYFGRVSGGSKISIGDTIFLKGYPKAIVGTVVEIQKNDTPLSNVFVRTPYNINNKEIFYVIQ